MVRFLVLIHLVAVIVWIGGMFFAHFCLRPVAAAQLPPPQRLALLGLFGRFFAVLAGALALLWGSGLARLAQVGAAVPWHWLAMAGLATVMTAILGLIVFRFHRRMARAVAANDWPRAGAAMNVVRRMVLTNLLLGFVTVAVAVLGA